MVVDILFVVLGVLLTVGTGIFVAAEFALVTVDPSAVDREIAAGNKAASGVRKALHHLSTELSGAQVGITLTTVLLGYTTQPAIQAIIGRWLDGAMSATIATTIAVVAAVVIVNGFSMLFGELVPKNLALSVPMRTAERVAPVQRAFTAALKPVIVMLNGSANAVLHRFGVELKEELSGGRSAQELASLVRRSAAAGTLASGTARLLTKSIEFGDLTAVDVMTDRTRMVVLDADNSAADVVQLARETGHSRFPVIGEDRDDIIGFVNLRKAIAVPYDRRADVPAAALMVDAPRVPETVRLGPLLVELRGHGLQMAVVVDEYGGTSGMVTLEDVVEEIVGDVTDEHDRRRSAARQTADGSWLVPGTIRPDEVRSEIGVQIPDDSVYETLAGYVMAQLGRIPKPNDVVETANGDTFVVVQVTGRRVDRLRVIAAPSVEGEES